MLRKYLVLNLLTLSLFTFSLSSLAASIQIAAGSYHGNYEVYSQPLLFKHENSAWTMIKNLTLPQGVKDTNIQSIGCKDDVCAVGGFYSDDTSHERPFLLISNNKSQSWSVINKFIGLPDNIYDATIKATLCNHATCMIAGDYRLYSEGKFSHPFALLSYAYKDTLDHWVIAKATTELPAAITSAGIQAATCNNEMCVSAGWYNKNGTDAPLLLRSVDNGISWRFTPIDNLPANQNFGIFKSINCSGSTCVSGGFYELDSAKNHQQPFLAISHNDGKTWSFVKEINVTGDVNNVYIDSVSCSGGSYIAAGGYTDSKDNYHTLLLVSKNEGQTWSAVSNIPNLPYNARSIDQVDCTDKSCVAVGAYLDHQQYAWQPLILISNNKGLSWIVVSNITNHPAGYSTQGPLSVHCTKQNCVIAGSYNTLSNSLRIPMLLESNNNGEKWSFVSLNLPSAITGNLDVVTDN